VSLAHELGSNDGYINFFQGILSFLIQVNSWTRVYPFNSMTQRSSSDS